MAECEIFTVTETFGGHNSMSAEVGTTTTPEREHDRHSKTYLRLEDTGSTQWKLKVNPHFPPEPVEFDNLESIELILEGDSEAHIIIEALEHFLHVLRCQMGVGRLRGTPERKLI